MMRMYFTYYDQHEEEIKDMYTALYHLIRYDVIKITVRLFGGFREDVLEVEKHFILNK